MDNHPIEGLMKSTLENLKDMIDVNTIVGDTIETKDGTLIIPISCVSLGFAAGGSEFYQKNVPSTDTKYPFGGGSGSGVTVKPIAFLVIKGDMIRLLPVNQKNTYDKLVDSIPQIIDTLKNSFSQKSCKKNKEEIKQEIKDAVEQELKREVTVEEY
ncbi:GerW family sporulation protein [Clostridium brassicae]|uniref:GerW family sporulation protein n=1 Tax=Clostridium brassicae TaxID=2999072 RepID=A0ABT4DCT5_9CLOT|nr:GerW family sporulation protein [Clostridium brassicae]MCY6959993.1 GerW family sporulation protein [Clostridium brassicae]